MVKNQIHNIERLICLIFCSSKRYCSMLIFAALNLARSNVHSKVRNVCNSQYHEFICAAKSRSCALKKHNFSLILRLLLFRDKNQKIRDRFVVKTFALRDHYFLGTKIMESETDSKCRPFFI